jgi:drug/metabolite transporter (DMT)-like permease
VFGALAYLLMNRALTLAPPSLLAPFEYTCILGAVTAGYLIWGETPDAATLAGAAVIIGSGVYIIHRERVLAAQKEKPVFNDQSAKTGSTSQL